MKAVQFAQASADQESFVGGGPSLTKFVFVVVLYGREEPNTTISGQTFGQTEDGQTLKLMLAW